MRYSVIGAEVGDKDWDGMASSDEDHNGASQRNSVMGQR